MGDRGRKPAAELATVTALPILKRPHPPRGLDKEQKAEWRRVVKSLPVDWFPLETHGMLTQYCKHFTAAKKIAVMISDLLGLLDPPEGIPLEIEEDAEEELQPKVFSLKEYDLLLKMQERESRAMTAIARSLRFTLQASYDKERKKANTGVGNPWEG